MLAVESDTTKGKMTPAQFDTDQPYMRTSVFSPYIPLFAGSVLRFEWQNK